MTKDELNDIEKLFHWHSNEAEKYERLLKQHKHKIAKRMKADLENTPFIEGEVVTSDEYGEGVTENLRSHPEGQIISVKHVKHTATGEGPTWNYWADTGIFIGDDKKDPEINHKRRIKRT